MTELLRVDCVCGNHLVLSGSEGWSVHFDGFPTFTCPCGKKHGLKIAPADTKESNFVQQGQARNAVEK